MKWAAGLLVLSLLACGSTHELKGSIRVIEQLGVGSQNRIGQSCTGTGGFDDLHAGTPVVVRDESAKILATGSLGEGRIVALETCEFAFSISDLTDSKFYQIEVSHRGSVTYSKDGLDQAAWKVTLNLG